MTYTVIRSKFSTAYAKVYAEPNSMGQIRVELFRSSRVKKPSVRYTASPIVEITKLFQVTDKKAQDAIESKFRTLEVGDILVTRYSDYPTWYRVTKLVGSKSVKLEKLKSYFIEEVDPVTGAKQMPDLKGEAKPIAKSFRVKNGDEVDVSSWQGQTMKWDGNPRQYRPYWD